MEENMPEDDDVTNNESIEYNTLGPSENAKRLKKDDSGISVENSEEPTSSDKTQSTTCSDQESAASTSGTSKDAGFSKTKSFKLRNYRNSRSDKGSSSDEQINEQNPVEEQPPPVAEASVQVEDIPDSAMDEEITSEDSSMESATSTVINDTESDSEMEEPTVLKKEKPKHNWFIIPEIVNRQIGQSAKFNPELFQRRCYGSLHCVQRLELMAKLEHHDGCVNSLNFHPNGTLLASGSDDLKVVIWDWKVGKSLIDFDTKHRGNVFQSKFLPLSGDLHIVTCARDGQVRLHQVATEGLRNTRKLGTHKGPCHKLSILDSQPQVILSAGEDGFVFRHDLRMQTLDRLVQVNGTEDHKVALYSISSNPSNNQEFCVGGRDYIVRTFDQRKCIDTSTRAVPLHVYYPNKLKKDYLGLHVTCAIYNYNGTEILTSYNDDDIYIFDKEAKIGQFSHQYQGHRNGATIKGVNYFGPKSEYIVSGSDCGNVYFWERNTESIVQWMLADDNGVVNCLEPHPQLPFICTSGLDWDVKLWVPSCEQAPPMEGLEDTVRRNNRSRFNVLRSNGVNESQILWMLWRHLRTTERLQRALSVSEMNDGEARRVMGREDLEVLLSGVSSSSSSSSSSALSDPFEDILMNDDDDENDDDDDDDGENGPVAQRMDCSPS